jgi:hypothetical protein
VRALVAAGLLITAATIGCAAFFPHANPGAIACHLSILAMLVVGAVFDDFLADLVRSFGAIVLLLLGFVSAIGSTQMTDGLPSELAAWYPALVAAVCCVYAFLVRDHTYLASAFVCVAAWLGWSSWNVYSRLRHVVAGLDQIVWGLVFFSVAMAISLRKAGVRTGLVSKPLVRLLGAYQAPAWRARRVTRLRR